VLGKVLVELGIVDIVLVELDIEVVVVVVALAP
jgi:hypothetical protein